MTTGQINHKMAEDLQRFLRNQSQKGLKLQLQVGQIDIPQIQLCYILNMGLYVIFIGILIVRMIGIK